MSRHASGRFTSLRFRTNASNSLGILSTLETAVADSVARPGLAETGIEASAAALPVACDVLAALQADPNVAGTLGTSLLSLVHFVARDDALGGQYQGRLDIVLDTRAFAPDDVLVIGLLAPSVTGDFQQLDFTVSQNCAEVVARSFSDAASALQFFDDQVLRLGAIQSTSTSPSCPRRRVLLQ